MPVKNYIAPSLPMPEVRQVQPGQSQPPRVWLIAFAGMLPIWVCMFLVGYRVLLNTGVAAAWSWPISLAISLYGYYRVMMRVLNSLTGNSLSMFEIEWWAKLGGKRLDNEARAEDHRHTEEMTRIAHEMRAAIEDQAQQIADLRRWTVQAGTQMQRLQPPVMAQVVPDTDQDAALVWASGLYGPDGQPDPAKVHENGYLRVKVPWKGEDRESWPESARDWLTGSPHGLPPILVQAGNSYNYKLDRARYPTVREVQNALGSVVTT